MEQKIKAYKAFDKDLSCRGFKYEVGKEYEETGYIKACEKGFHACPYPLDVFVKIIDNSFPLSNLSADELHNSYYCEMPVLNIATSIAHLSSQWMDDLPPRGSSLAIRGSKILIAASVLIFISH